MEETRYLAFYKMLRDSKQQILRHNVLISERYLTLEDTIITFYKDEEHTKLIKEIYMKDILYVEIGIALLPYLLRYYSSFSIEIKIVCLQESVTISFLYYKDACLLIEDLKVLKIPIMDPILVLNFVSINSNRADWEALERHFKKHGKALAKKHKQVDMSGSITNYTKN